MRWRSASREEVPDAGSPERVLELLLEAWRELRLARIADRIVLAAERLDHMIALGAKRR